MTYQSLYRRYRSGTFGELVGQEHVVTALRNAIVEDRVGHAYLFSGPRGTGKTSTARILAKALNCTDLSDAGEPCCVCESCVSFASGTSYDLQELDAASNNGVEAIRDLISRVALGSPGRTKVYILDEVHMLSKGAENALLKTLEEPPEHVVFVLATTEPHKVVPTIRSRTQHYEFELIPAEPLGAHVRWIAEDAGLDVSDEWVDYVLRAGGGSARDTLSALDQIVAAGGLPRDDDAIGAILAGVGTGDPRVVVAAVHEAITSGRDPRVIGETALGRLRDAFLLSMGAGVAHLSEAQNVAARELADAMGPAAITRALEVLGTMLIEMRQAPDPRVDLEVALLRLSRPDLDTDLAAVVARLERLEQGGVAAVSTATAPAAAAAPAAPAIAATPPDAPAAPSSAPVAADAAAPPVAPAAAGGSRPADSARAALAAQRGGGTPPAAPQPEPQAPAPPQADAPATPPAAATDTSAPAARPTLGAARRGAATEPAAAPAAPAAPLAAEPVPEAAPAAADPPPAAPAPVAAGSGASGIGLPALEAAWADIRAQLPGRARSRFSGGRFLDVAGEKIVFGLPNAIHRERCVECIDDVQAAIGQHFSTPVTLELVVDGEAEPPTRAADPTPAAPSVPAESEESVDLDALTDAAPETSDGLGMLTDAFPGAELVDRPDAKPE